MEPFISKIIDILLADKSVPMHEVAVILPNRRAGRILLKGLYEKNGGKPLFAPQIFPMEEFVSYLSPLKVIDQVSQLLRLHSLTRQFQGDRFAMHQLLTWGTAFLKDISDMDMQLQDVPAILKEYAEAAKFEISFGKAGVVQKISQNMQKKCLSEGWFLLDFMHFRHQNWKLFAISRNIAQRKYISIQILFIAIWRG